MKERLLEVAPSRGEVVSWWAFRRGRFESPSLMGRLLALTTVLTDAVGTMWDVCRALDPQCTRKVLVPNGFTSTYFQLEFRATRFAVTAERQLRQRTFPFNPLVAEFAASFEILFHLRSEDEGLLQHMTDLFRQKSTGARIVHEAWL
jgi:hypothetical protein